MKTALFCVNTKRVVVIYSRRFGTNYGSNSQGSRIKNLTQEHFGFLNPKDGTDRLSRNFGKKLPPLAAL
jgi:hypothetical protein